MPCRDRWCSCECHQLHAPGLLPVNLLGVLPVSLEAWLHNGLYLSLHTSDIQMQEKMQVIQLRDRALC